MSVANFVTGTAPSRLRSRACHAFGGAILLVSASACVNENRQAYQPQPYFWQGQRPPPPMVEPMPMMPPPQQQPSQAPASPADPAAAQVRDKVLASSQALAHVTGLVDEVGPRLAGSEGEPRAVAWAVARMKELGFSNVHTEAVKETRWVRGREEAQIMGPNRRSLAITTLGGSVTTRERGIDAEVVEVASLEALAALPDDQVKGKIVFMHVIMERARDGAGYGKAVGARVGGPSAAAKKGAIGFLVRSMATGDDRAPHTGALHYIDGVAKIPGGALGVADAELLHRIIARGKPVKLHLVLTPQELSPVDGANVVGDVPGSSLPSEIVLLGAHLDSWELGMGALDDGAGCAIVLEAGRAIAASPIKPRRTVRVVLFANEENGTAGAKAYAKAHEPEWSKHIVAMEADFGDGHVYEARLLTDPQHSGALGDVASLLAPLAARVSPDGAEGGADISPLRAVGVPIVDLRQDGTRYFDVHHSENDVLEKIQKSELDQAASTYAGVAYALANRASDLGRVPEAKREHHW